jgi:2-polyprenyl-6-methoxyphenol hydroxylase-like FAD-dependent oxidoreductase
VLNDPKAVYVCHCWKRMAIVGGWPGGLTLARLLQQAVRRFPCMSVIRAAARVQGSALDLRENSGLAALEAAGLIDAFWANHRPDLEE